MSSSGSVWLSHQTAHMNPYNDMMQSYEGGLYGRDESWHTRVKEQME